MLSIIIPFQSVCQTNSFTQFIYMVNKLSLFQTVSLFMETEQMRLPSLHFWEDMAMALQDASQRKILLCPLLCGQGLFWLDRASKDVYCRSILAFFGWNAIYQTIFTLDKRCSTVHGVGNLTEKWHFMRYKTCRCWHWYLEKAAFRLCFFRNTCMKTTAISIYSARIDIWYRIIRCCSIKMVHAKYRTY